jgi:hypothetical protein
MSTTVKDEGPLDWEGNCERCGAAVTFSEFCGLLPQEMDKKGRHASHNWLVCDLRVELAKLKGQPLPPDTIPTIPKHLIESVLGDKVWGLWFLGDKHEKSGWCADAGDHGPVLRSMCEDWLSEFSTGGRYRHLYKICRWSLAGPLGD